MLRRILGGKSTPLGGLTNSLGLVYVDAENCKTSPQDLMNLITTHHGSKPAETFAYSKWSAKSQQTKKYREAGFRLLQADSGDNNADIMMCLDAYQRVRDLASKGVQGNIYICFHGDKGFTHLLEKLRAISGWSSIWVTSNEKPNKMIENSASETLRISSSSKGAAKKAPAKAKDAANTEKSQKVLKSTDDFKQIIMQAIGEDEIRSSLFGSKIIKYQKTNDWSETGKKAFNTRFGFPKNQSYKATISTELSSEIEISGEGADVAYKRTSASETLIISSSSKGAAKKAPAKAKSAANTETIQKVRKSTDDFKQIIMREIGEDEVSSTFFGSKIIKYQKMNDWPETGKKAFNTRFGFPKNQSYKATISTELSSEIEISGEGAAVTYKRKSVSLKEQKFPKITGFNTGGKGLKFPQNPDILANVLLLNGRLEDGLTKKERVDIIHSKLVIGRTRVNGVLIRLVQLELIESKSPLEALAGLQSRFDSSADEIGDWTPRNIENIQHYFQQAQVSLE